MKEEVTGNLDRILEFNTHGMYMATSDPDHVPTITTKAPQDSPPIS